MRLAPRAMRMPISRRRSRTANATTPKTPAADMSRLTPANTANASPKRRIAHVDRLIEAVRGSASCRAAVGITLAKASRMAGRSVSGLSEAVRTTSVPAAYGAAPQDRYSCGTGSPVRPMPPDDEPRYVSSTTPTTGSHGPSPVSPI